MDRRDKAGGNRSGPAGVVGRAGQVGMGVNWDVRSDGASAVGIKKYLRASTLVGYVSEYRSFYRGSSGRRTGGGTADSSDPFQDIQHPEQPERGPGIHPASNVPGQYGPRHNTVK